MNTERIRIEEDTMEEIRNIATETGETPEVLSERFKKIMEDLLVQVPPDVLEMQKLNSSFADKKDYKVAV